MIDSVNQGKPCSGVPGRCPQLALAEVAAMAPALRCTIWQHADLKANLREIVGQAFVIATLFCTEHSEQRPDRICVLATAADNSHRALWDAVILCNSLRGPKRDS